MKNFTWFMVGLLALSFPLGAQALTKTLTKRSYMDARHCLNLPTTEQVIRCAERYM